MDQDNSKDLDTTETEATQGEGTSRRRFLTGGTAALVGVAAAAVPGRSKAAPPNCAAANKAERSGIVCRHNDLEPVTHYLDDAVNGHALVAVVVKAWSDLSYYSNLVTHDPSDITDLANTRNALEFMGVQIDPNKTPIVLTQVKFEQRGYRIPQNQDQIVYVLPKPPVGGGATGQAARDAMAAVPFGM